jgi:hypothetical protein
MRRRRLRPPAVDVQLPLFAHLYGLDIETDTTIDGLDPQHSQVVAASVSTDEGQLVFRGPEPDLLRSLDRYLASLPPGVLVTWNGSGFDLPFLADRARTRRVKVGLRLRADAALPHRHAPIHGHDAPYRATWHGHGHLDACCLYRTLLPEGKSCGLKPVALDAGLPVVHADTTAIHLLDPQRLDRYVASDAWLARELGQRAWADAGRVIDAA